VPDGDDETAVGERGLDVAEPAAGDGTRGDVLERGARVDGRPVRLLEDGGREQAAGDGRQRERVVGARPVELRDGLGLVGPDHECGRRRDVPDDEQGGVDVELEVRDRRAVDAPRDHAPMSGTLDRSDSPVSSTRHPTRLHPGSMVSSPGSTSLPSRTAPPRWDSTVGRTLVARPLPGSSRGEKTRSAPARAR
jgi:hypothetical protein